MDAYNFKATTLLTHFSVVWATLTLCLSKHQYHSFDLNRTWLTRWDVQCLILVSYLANLNPQMQLKSSNHVCTWYLIMISVLYVIKFGVLLNYQVAGLTNNSYIAEAHEVRHCVQKYKTLGKYVLQVAKVLNRLLKLW